ncbi:hypothetical protein [Pseudoxanthomonas sacheonensis]|uniref:Uncharacterized protein n=1 Tax=Pseudoxanthomonas sacheonensis TaxID=443615 RepID=A0ABU1RRI9_9GAMM|nr:hypothetical protein [Pseudoxanthomonas sacheonensis]MDR6840915.1 hypothetical protein [Pseudoxanthomonas sacheonensis]
MHKTKIVFVLAVLAAIAIICVLATNTLNIGSTLFGVKTESSPEAASVVSSARVGQSDSDSSDDGLSASTAQAQASGNDSTAAHLISTEKVRPVESLLVSPGGLRVGYINAIIGVDEFNRVLNRLKSESYTDPDATEISRVYEENLKAALKTSGAGVSLDKLACGLTACAASFNGKLQDERSFTTMLLGAGSNGGVGIYSAIVRSFPPSIPNGLATYRVVFSTDKNNNAITVN